MAKMSRRRSNLPVRRAQNEWVDPFERMRDMMAEWDPLEELSRGWGGSWEGRNYSPDFNVRETNDSYVFTADLPGFEEDDIDIQLSGNRLTVSGNRKEEKTDKGDNYYVYERSYGSFTRTFTLPDGVDAKDIQAEIEKGVLTLNVPKPVTAQPTKIAIGRTNKAQKQITTEGEKRPDGPH